MKYKRLFFKSCFVCGNNQRTSSFLSHLGTFTPSKPLFSCLGDIFFVIKKKRNWVLASECWGIMRQSLLNVGSCCFSVAARLVRRLWWSSHRPSPCRTCLNSSKIQRAQIRCFSTWALLLPPHPDFSLHGGICEALYPSRHACCARMSRSNHKIMSDFGLVWFLCFQKSHSRADKMQGFLDIFVSVSAAAETF